jgi:predicted nuclease with TOPRIM domain
VKAQAEEKIASANAEIERQNRLKASEVAALQSNLKKDGVRLAALERQLQQKTKEAQELSSICEELMKAMGRNQ